MLDNLLGWHGCSQSFILVHGSNPWLVRTVPCQTDMPYSSQIVVLSFRILIMGYEIHLSSYLTFIPMFCFNEKRGYCFTLKVWPNFSFDWSFSLPTQVLALWNFGLPLFSNSYQWNPAKKLFHSGRLIFCYTIMQHCQPCVLHADWKCGICNVQWPVDYEG